MRRRAVGISTGIALLLTSCGNRTEQYVLPDQVADFSILYANNCAACHGPNGRGGAARPLNDALYLALIGKDRLREVIAKGVTRTAMPPFAEDAGGTLIERQLTILADEMEARWGRPQDFGGVALPPYSAPLGDTARGESAFRTYCSTCHGADGTGGPKGHSVVDSAFLALVSDQSLRTMVIAGRADQAIPDWRGDAAGRVMAPQEISDVVAWLAQHRELPGNVARGGTNLP
jgi:cytochrome c oxidase cbb3-type subunit 3